MIYQVDLVRNQLLGDLTGKKEHFTQLYLHYLKEYHKHIKIWSDFVTCKKDTLLIYCHVRQEREK